MLSLSSCGLRAVVLGLDNLLLGPSPAAIPDPLRERLFHRVVLDPANEPLAPLFSSAEGISASAPRLLSPFFGGHEIPYNYVKASLYEGYAGSESLRRDLEAIARSGITLAVWDNCIAGSTASVHTLIDKQYSGLFPRSHRFLSTARRTLLGRQDFLDVFFGELGIVPDGLLVVTANPGQRDYALRCGMKAMLFEPFAEGPSSSLLASLAEYLGIRDSDGGGPVRIQDPVAYLDAVCRAVNDPEFDREVRSLPPDHPIRETVARIRKEVLDLSSCGVIGSDIRCFLIDQAIHGANGIASRLAETVSFPLFKSEDDVRRDVMNVAESHLAQVGRGIPPLARAAIGSLVKDLALLSRVNEAALLETGIVRDIERRLFQHITGNWNLYVRVAQVFTDEEWAELGSVFYVDHPELDRRYESWVNNTEHALHAMAAGGETLSDIRAMVRERLIDDLVLAVMDIEMIVRSHEEGKSRSELFPRHHDAKNRAAALTANIDNKRLWKKSVVLQTTTVQGWIHSMVMRMLRYARQYGARLTFGFSKDAALPSIELSDLTEAEREALDHILTELITNAVKHGRSDDASPSEVSIEVEEEEGSIRLEVADRGPGFEEIGMVLDGTAKHSEGTEGYGGGLASILRHVGDRKGWTLAPRPRPGGGTVFVLNAPITHGDRQKKRLSDSGFPIV